MNQQKVYFASDLHLGLPSLTESRSREKLFVQWLDLVKTDASEIFLLGDIFDFWYEYKRVVPKGYTRFLGKVAEIVDSGIPVHFFTGNHDVWMFDYFPQELGVSLHKEPIVREFNGKKFLIGHGDGLGPGDPGYKLLKSIFTNKTLQWLFARLHPNFSLWFGNRWSVSSRYSKEIAHKFREENEQITKFARITLKNQLYNFFVFGHWHSPVVYSLSQSSNLVLLGDWIVSNTYGVWDGEKFSLRKYSGEGEGEVVGEGF
ncbi:MAG TPA: UDP-2,3-diacylglucosamine diphosphatase [Tenuifilaceae bacterium]|nr:UDP-2,3-diacylglucosamine diphosphatase [Tenuifilaceae bacterium]HPE18643.1 UDP-2,3-diacylglucosamine diphosphatase [Tenuifilaceae bacterium]HPJ46075.1 UDP-2,3-diacylglucosamine diphosphatase [Tenuifilaceae bacterium]HPQ34419.1 UDP-2,3-diacylglucosamine diphosphatase [Tenuifilaceae bacterium]HRX67815.1 UDP-2,3-diacylglucosamine diphosphatase [Tenuifilaceae bacterium]